MILAADGTPATALDRTLGPVRMPAPSDLSRWQGDVQRIWGGPNEQVSWLHLDWYDDEDVNRLVLWQVIPIGKCSDFVRDLLLGPPPGKDAYGRPRGIPMVRIQWEMCQKLHGWAQAFWIIQGDKGGHKRRFNHVEQSLLKLMGRPTEAPIPGALPYAPFDGRVVAQVQKQDTMAKYSKMLDFAERRPEQIDAEERETILGLRREYQAWLEQQADAHFDNLTRAELQSLSDAPKSQDAAAFDYDAATEELLNRE